MDIKKEPDEDAEWRKYKEDFFDDGCTVKPEVDDAEINFYSEGNRASEAPCESFGIIKNEMNYIDQERYIETVENEETNEEERLTSQKNAEISSGCNSEVPLYTEPYLQMQIDEVDVKKEGTVDGADACQYDGFSRLDIPPSELVPLVTLRKDRFYARNFVCGVCYEIYPTLVQLKFHEDTVCRIGKRAAVDEHASKRNNSSKLYSCTKCLFQCKMLCDLQLHRNSHYGDKPFKCGECSYACRHFSKLKRHKMSHTGEKPFKCDECEYSCVDFSNMKRHSVVHTGDKPLKCADCSFTCLHLGTMKKHKMIHSGEKPFKCEECDYSCRQFKCLKVHKLIHSGEKPFKCDECAYACRDASNLKKHKMIHSGEKPLKCDECDYSCIFSSNLKSHKMNHSGEKPYRCDKCDHAFTRLIHLKRHQSIHCRG